MKTNRLVCAFLAVCLLAISAAGQSISNPDTFITGSSASVETFDPQFVSSRATTELTDSIYDALLAHSYEDPELLIPELATVVPTSDNGLITIAADGATYISLPVRGGVKFHNGVELTLEDVEYTIKRAIVTGANKSLALDLLGAAFSDLVDEIGYDEAFDALERAVQVEGNIITFRLVEPNVVFVDSLTGGSAQILNKAWCIEQGCWPGTRETGQAYMNLTAQADPIFDKTMGTGPFKLASWEPMERVVLESFDEYWQGSPQLKRVIRQIVTDAQTQILMLQNGDVDFITVGTANLPLIEGAEGITVLTNLPSTQVLKMNLNWDIAEASSYIGDGQLGPDGIPTDFFSDIDVRKGFAYCFDWDTLINEIFLGNALKLYGPVPIGFPTANPDNPQYSLDLEKAEEHFRKAWGGEVWENGFHFTAVGTTGWRSDALGILIDNIESLNSSFEIDVATLPWASYIAGHRQGQLPIVLLGMLPDVLDPYPPLSFDMYSKGNYAQWCGYAAFAEENYDALIEELKSNYDPDRRREISYELQRLAYEFAHTIYLYQAVNHVAMRDWVQGYVPGLYPGIVDFYYLSKAY